MEIKEGTLAVAVDVPMRQCGESENCLVIVTVPGNPEESAAVMSKTGGKWVPKGNLFPLAQKVENVAVVSPNTDFDEALRRHLPEAIIALARRLHELEERVQGPTETEL